MAVHAYAHVGGLMHRRTSRPQQKWLSRLFLPADMARPENRGYDCNMKTTVTSLDFGTSKIVTLVAENSGAQRCDIVGAGIVTYTKTTQKSVFSIQK